MADVKEGGAGRVKGGRQGAAGRPAYMAAGHMETKGQNTVNCHGICASR